MNYIDFVENSKQAVTITEMPRNINQVYNHKKYIFQKQNKNLKTKDEYSDALINRLKSTLVKFCSYIIISC